MAGHGKDIHTRMPYLARAPLYSTQKPFIADFPVDETPESQQTNHLFELLDITIHDAQPFRHDMTLERNGFCFLRARTSLTADNAVDMAFAETVYYEELEGILHSAFPQYERIEYLDYGVRKRAEAFPSMPGAKVEHAQPASLPHSDFTIQGGFMAMRQFFPSQEEHYKDRDFDLLNVWRVLKGPNNDWPLALCDSASVDLKRDVIFNDVLREDAVGENNLMHSNPDHKWYYLADQDEEDLLVFRNTDSRGARPTAFHAAFDTEAKQSFPRHSVELRVVAFR